MGSPCLGHPGCAAAPPRRSSPQLHGCPAPAALGVAAPAVLAAAAIRGCGRAMEGARARARRGREGSSPGRRETARATAVTCPAAPARVAAPGGARAATPYTAPYTGAPHSGAAPACVAAPGGRRGGPRRSPCGDPRRGRRGACPALRPREGPRRGVSWSCVLLSSV